MSKGNKKQNGGNIDLSDQQKFFTDYIKSTNYKNRLKKQGYVNPDRVVKDRLSNAKGMSANEMLLDTQYIQESNFISVNTPQLQNYGLPLKSTLAHEFSHGVGALEESYAKNKNLGLNSSETKEFQKRNLLTKVDARGYPLDKELQIMHDRKASENKADIDTLRYHLKKDKIYNTGTQQFSKEFLKKAKEKYKSNTVVNRLFTNFSDEDLIYLMNNIAKEDMKNTSDTNIAKMGAYIQPKKKKKAQNGFEAIQNPKVNRDELLKDVGQVKDPTISTPPELLTYGGIKGNKFDWNSAAKAFNLALLGVDALIPPEKPPVPVVQPLDSYNPHPYGTGSQAIAQDGKNLKYKKTLEPLSYKKTLEPLSFNRTLEPLSFKRTLEPIKKGKKAQEGTKISNTGYKNTSPDKNAPQLMIPSNRITMKDVQMPVFGQDNLGYSQMMMPNQEYKFPGKYVTETPMRAQNGGTFQNQQHLYLENQKAKSLASKKQLFGAQNMYVGQNVGDPIPQYIGSGNTTIPQSMISKQVPSYVKSLEWDQEANLPYYIDEQTGYMQHADKKWADDPKYRKTQELQIADMASMRMAKGGDISPEKAKKILHDGTIRGKKITEKQRRFFGAKSNKAENGLQIEDNNYKPISPNMIELTGDSHAEGGVDVKYGDTTVEGQGREPISFNRDKSITFFGELKLDGTNKKFSTIARELAKKQTKSVEIAEKGLELINNNSPYDKLGKYAFNSGKIMLIGGKKKYEELTALTEHLSDLQGASLEADSDGGNMMSPPKKQGLYEAKNGLKIKAQTGIRFMQGRIPKKYKDINGNEYTIEELKERLKDYRGIGAEDHIKGFYPGADEWLATMAGEKKNSPSSVEVPTPIQSTEDPITLYSELEAKTLAKLQALYPGRKVEIKIDESFGKGGARPISTQRGIKGAGRSETDVSLHNFNAAKDYKIYIDGKYISGSNSGEKDIYKNTLWAAADEVGLYTAKNWKNSNDLGHVGLVPESASQRNKLGVFKDLLTKYPALKDSPQFKETLDYLSTTVKGNKGTQEELSAYRQLTGDTGKYKTIKADYKANRITPPKGKTWYGEGFDDAPPDFTQEGFEKGKFTYRPKDKQPINNPEYKGKFQFTEPSPRPMPTNAEGLELTQILPELYTAATNQVDPVHMQQFTPELYQPYQVSFQDRLNQNQGTFAATSQYMQDSPEALATLAGQKYSADSQVLADEFRTNQQMANEITNKNTALLNEAELKNLQLADIQYTRQTQAKSNTKAQNYNILDSISNKLLQRQRDNRELQIYENLYDFRFDKETGRKSYEGVPGNELVNFPDAATTNPAIPTSSMPQLNQYQSFNQRIDKFGNPVGGTIRTPSLQDQLSKKISLSRYSKIGGSKKIADLLQQKYAYEALYP